MKTKLDIALKALHKIHSFEYDNYGMYDDDFEQQRDWLLDIASKALTEINKINVSAVEQQYNAVVAQNKSLQGELRLYKKMVDVLIEHRELSNRTGIKYISF